MKLFKPPNRTFHSNSFGEAFSMFWEIILGTVIRRIFRSFHKDRFLAYLMSKRTISLKVVRFLPLICQRPVNPGTASRRFVCHEEYC
jgi:hypothetical protein